MFYFVLVHFTLQQLAKAEMVPGKLQQNHQSLSVETLESL